MRTKIVLIHNTIKYIELHYREFVEALLERGLDVVCIAPTDDSVAELEKINVACHHISLTRKGINPIAEIQALLALRSILVQEKPDIVFNYSIKPVIYGSLAARAIGVKHIFSLVTGLGYVFLADALKQRLLKRVVASEYRLAMKCNEKVFFHNPDDRDVFVRNSFVVFNKTVVLDGTGIDAEKYRPTDVTPREASFLMVGRLLSDKGVLEYVEAARRLKRTYKNAEFLLLGPFDDNPASIKSEDVSAWEKEGIVRYMGETDDVRPFLANSSVFVLPSYREGLPRATLEAMAMGKPVVTTDVPGCRETVVVNENGLLVPPRDSTALAYAMEQFLLDPSLAQRMGLRSRELVLQRFDVRRVNERILEIIQPGIVDER